MKKTLITLICVLAVLSFVSTSFAATSTLLEYPRLYRSMRSLGMGSAYTAVGGDVEALFYNPAGLHDIDFTVEVLNPLMEFDENAIDIGQDIIDALDLATEADRLNALTAIIRQNQGKPLHGRVSLFPNVAWKNYAAGFLGQAGIDARLHEALGSAGIVETQTKIEYGPVAGASFALPVEGLRVGLGAKWIVRTSVNENFTAQQLASDGFDLADFDTTNDDFSFDLGVMYDIPLFGFLKPRVGLSVLDITDLDFDRGGKIPTRLNLGFSLSPEIPKRVAFVFAFDYEDVTEAFDQDSSTWKRIHLGAEAGFLKRRLMVRLGLNQGYATAGVEVDLRVLRLGYAYYSEETGAYAGQDRDTRHVVQLVLGW